MRLKKVKFRLFFPKKNSFFLGGGKVLDYIIRKFNNLRVKNKKVGLVAEQRFSEKVLRVFDSFDFR